MSQSHCLAPTTPKLSKVPLTAAAATSHFLLPTDLNYSLYADNFDLSLLPQDCISLSENIPTTVYQFTNDVPTTPIITTKSETTTKTTTTSPSTTPQIKIEQTWSYHAINAEDVKQEPNLNQQQQQQQVQQQPASASQHQHHHHHHHPHQQFITLPPPAYPHVYPSPQSSPAQSEYGGGFSQTQYAGCYDSLSSATRSTTLYPYPSSPCPSIEAANIKQELHILPPSPPESNCEAPSPHSTCADIKLEPIDADVESSLVDLNTLLKKQQSYDEYSSSVQQQTTSASPSPQQDHQLLREYLEDTTFQKKHNLKPLALESFIGDLEEVRGDIEPVISLALEYAKREADETCAKLHISQDPSAWTPIQVHAWLRSTIAQFKLPQIDDLDLKFSEDGAALILLSEEEFTRRTPESGSFLHAQLEIWKLTFTDNYRSINSPQQTQINAVGGYDEVAQVQNGIWSTENGQQSTAMEVGDDSEDEDDILPSTSSAAAAAAAGAIPTTTNNASVVPKRAGATPGRTGGSHIHLWQFLKELLAVPHINGTAIRWIERSKGIFKIEDSVRVAKLWGKRKNRPAMNYDKLSRSIRQYYKKGIMKKTERSQRLVYQFCHPYHL